MIRTTIIPDKRVINISLEVPENYVGEEVEVIAFTKNEGKEEKALPKKNVSFSALSIDTKNFKFDRDEANKR